MTKDQIQCTENLKVDFSNCFAKCEGMDIISYDAEEVDSKRENELSKMLNLPKNPKLMKIMKKLSDQYNKYKESYIFPTELNSNFELLILL